MVEVNTNFINYSLNPQLLTFADLILNDVKEQCCY